MSAINPLAHINYSRPSRQWDLVPLDPRWGVEVRGFDFNSLPNSTLVDSLRQLLHSHQVLFFKDCRVGYSQLLELAGLFGEPEVASVRTSSSLTGAQSGADGIGARLRSHERVLWQSDCSFRRRPCSVAIVYTPHSAPEPCGHSILSNAFLAFESLSEAIRRRVAQLTAIHRSDCQMRLLRNDANEVPGTHVRDLESSEHPVVVRHPVDGRSYLNVNEAFTHHLVSVAAPESRALLPLLTQQFYRSEHQVQIEWHRGSLAIWNPRTVQHYGPAHAFGCRTLVRVSARLTS